MSLYERNLVLQHLPYIARASGLIHNIALATGLRMRDVERSLVALKRDGMAQQSRDGYWHRTPRKAS